ncbi:outer membrane beta-barrel protein [Erythrobacter ani]|uniref:Outer membrane beta-barrel protein n=1 Tax=Erythrobacter ani TaxID=2827235 RepID=A0ABS6SJV0_9SPHN|nr:outer membrane beta-barrel protein [Erythrobacter ani]MBV7264743.1 outer membrane beta-barrel protein [Erythrobacter ani]
MIKINAPRTIALALTLPAAAFASSASAQSSEFNPEGGFYVSVQAGVSSPTDETFDGIQDPVAGSPGVAGAPAQVEVEYDEGFNGTAAIGYRLPRAVFGLLQPSVEIEYAYSEADVSGGSFNGGIQRFDGDVEVHTVSLNYQTDFRWSNEQRFIPFIGGGIGIADVDHNANYFPADGIATAPTFAVTGGDTGLSLQSNIGIQYVLSDNIELQTRVRYQRITGLDFERRFVGGGADLFNADLDGRFETINVLAGVRYRF